MAGDSCGPVLFVVAALLALALPVLAQALPPMPDAGPDDYVIGGLGVAGAPVRVREELSSLGPGVAAAFRVREALEKSPAEGRLLAGDAIVGAERRLLGARDDVVLALEAAVERAEASASGQLELAVVRGGRTVPVKLRVARLGAHGKTCPRKCKKCERVAALALDYLVKRQEQSGAFPTDLGGVTGKVVMTSLGGLALLAAGAGPGNPLEVNLTRALTYVIAHIGKDEGLSGLGLGKDAGAGSWNQVNWQLAYGGIFLAEAASRLRSAEALSKLAEASVALARNQEASGGWGHGPGGPNALGYVELEVMSNVALTALGLARRMKVQLQPEVIASGIRYVEECADGNGGIAYSTRPGQKGFGEAGRTAGAIVALAACGQRQHPLFSRMANYLRGRLKDLGSGHVSPTMHTLWGALASFQLGEEEFAAYFAMYRPRIMAARGVDGSFTAVPTEETLQLKSNTDRLCGPIWTTASYVIVLKLADRRLNFLGARQ